MAKAQNNGLVSCTDNCALNDVFTTANNIYDFLVTKIAAPLAVVAIIIGGVLMMTSAGDPGRMGIGKKVFYAAVIGLVLAFATKAIVNFALGAVGWTGNYL